MWLLLAEVWLLLAEVWLLLAEVRLLQINIIMYRIVKESVLHNTLIIAQDDASKKRPIVLWKNFNSRVHRIKRVLTLTLTSESVYGSQFFHRKLLQVLMS